MSGDQAVGLIVGIVLILLVILLIYFLFRGRDESAVARSAPSIPLASHTDDDLTMIEGIGPKIRSVLHEGGIHRFQDLTGVTPEWIKDVLQKRGIRLVDPTTWSEQAKMLADGEWMILRDSQRSCVEAGKDKIISLVGSTPVDHIQNWIYDCEIGFSN